MQIICQSSKYLLSDLRGSRHVTYVMHSFIGQEVSLLSGRHQSDVHGLTAISRGVSLLVSLILLQ